MSDEANVLAGRSVATNERGYRTEVRAGRHHFQADEPVARGGTDDAASPTQLLVGALGSCTAITLRMYAAHKGWELGTLTVDCRIFYVGGDRKHQTIERTIRIGGDLTDEQRARLAEIADKTPVTLAIAGATPIETTIA